MSALIERVYEEAIELSINDRLVLIDKLMHSANLPVQSDIDAAWSAEVAKRIQDLESGKAKLVPGKEVFAKIKERFEK